MFNEIWHKYVDILDFEGVLKKNKKQRTSLGFPGGMTVFDVEPPFPYLQVLLIVHSSNSVTFHTHSLLHCTY